MSIPSLIVGSLIMFIAGLGQGLTGFGFALISIPILIIFLSPKTVVPIIIIVSVAVNLLMLFQVRKWIDLKRIWPLLAASTAGLPLGILLLVFLDGNVLKILIGATTIPFAIAFMFGVHKEIKNERLAFITIGLFAGLLQTSTSLSGPPIILFLINQRMDKLAFRANLVAYFLLLGLISIGAFALGGVLNADVGRFILSFMPAAVLGALLGIRLAHRVNEKAFRTVALIIVTAGSALAIASGLGLY